MSRETKCGKRKRNGGMSVYDSSNGIINRSKDNCMQVQIILEIYKDLRDEIKRRIEERNNYFIQAILSFGAILTVVFTQSRLFSICACLAGFILSFIFFMLIRRSYTIGEDIKRYLKVHIEPRMQNLSTVKPLQRYREKEREKKIKELKNMVFYKRIWNTCSGFTLNETKISELISVFFFVGLVPLSFLLLLCYHIYHIRHLFM